MERREFIRLSALTGGFIALGGCQRTIDGDILPSQPHYDLVINSNLNYAINSNGTLVANLPITSSTGSISMLDERDLTENIHNDLELKNLLHSSKIYEGVPKGLELISQNYKVNKDDVLKERQILEFSLANTEIQASPSPSARGTIGGTIGNFKIVGTYHWGYLGACIKKNITHLGFLIRDKRSNKLLFDVHIAAWRNGRNVCVGVYESASGWCRSTCGGDIWRGIRNSLLVFLSAYVAYSTAIVLAEFIATIATPLVIGLIFI